MVNLKNEMRKSTLRAECGGQKLQGIKVKSAIKSI